MPMFGKRPNPFARSYDTQLPPDEEALYQVWRSRLPLLLQGTADYDLRGAFRGAAREATNGHLPDTWKKPNHMTFSSESQYADDRHPGGNWVGVDDGPWSFFAPARGGPPAAQLQNYFQRYEPDARLVLPAQVPKRRR